MGVSLDALGNLVLAPIRPAIQRRKAGDVPANLDLPVQNSFIRADIFHISYQRNFIAPINLVIVKETYGGPTVEVRRINAFTSLTYFLDATIELMHGETVRFKTELVVLAGADEHQVAIVWDESNRTD
jgi:hypothetical protein